jgi:hypothetical protein
MQSLASTLQHVLELVITTKTTTRPFGSKVLLLSNNDTYGTHNDTTTPMAHKNMLRKRHNDTYGTHSPHVYRFCTDQWVYIYRLWKRHR